MGEPPLACQRKSCLFRDPRTHGFDTLPSAQPAVAKGSTCLSFCCWSACRSCPVQRVVAEPLALESTGSCPSCFPSSSRSTTMRGRRLGQVVNPPESHRRGCQWSARRWPRSSEVASLVNTQTPKTRRAVIAILAPAKTSFPGLVCHSVGLVVQGCQFTALFTKHALLGFASN